MIPLDRTFLASIITAAVKTENFTGTFDTLTHKSHLIYYLPDLPSEKQPK